MLTINDNILSRKVELTGVSSSVVFDSAIAWTVTPQALLSMDFSRQEYFNGLPFPSPGDLPDPGIKPRSSSIAGRGVFTV